MDLIADFSESQKYDVEGFPFVYRELSKTNEELDEDYFSERRDVYIFKVALIKKDVFELLHFYWNLFWPDQIETVKDSKDSILRQIEYADIEFNIPVE